MRADGTVASHGFGRSSVCHCVDTDSKAAAHLPFPGIGHLRADGKGYDWVPANYTALR
jgi:hypothetical protein